MLIHLEAEMIIVVGLWYISVENLSVVSDAFSLSYLKFVCSSDVTLRQLVDTLMWLIHIPVLILRQVIC